MTGFFLDNVHSDMHKMVRKKLMPNLTKLGLLNTHDSQLRLEEFRINTFNSLKFVTLPNASLINTLEVAKHENLRSRLQKLDLSHSSDLTEKQTVYIAT